MKNAQVQFNSDRVGQFFNVSYLEGCTIATELGTMEADVIVIPKESFRTKKAELDEEGNVVEAKGEFAGVSSKTAEGYGMSFNNGIGVQLSIYKPFERKTKKSIFASEEVE